MGRKHRRNDEPAPLTITRDDIPTAPPGAIWRTREQREADQDAWHAARTEERKRRHAAARRARVAAAVDWDACCIAGCGDKVRVHDRQRDVDLRLPVCTHHAVIIKRQIDPAWDDEGVMDARRDAQVHREQIRYGSQRAAVIDANGGSSKGQLYFVRLNGLVKVGWSAELVKRLKAYGPDVEILCHYPGTRQDETLMHRQLKPYLAKGREWFEDCKVVEDIVAGIVQQHGPPTLSAEWTAPKSMDAKPRRWSA